MNAVKPLPAVGEVKRVGEVEEALGVGKVVVAAAAVEEAVDKLPLLLADQSFNRTLENIFSNYRMGQLKVDLLAFELSHLRKDTQQGWPRYSRDYLTATYKQ